MPTLNNHKVFQSQLREIYCRNATYRKRDPRVRSINLARRRDNRLGSVMVLDDAIKFILDGSPSLLHEIVSDGADVSPVLFCDVEFKFLDRLSDRPHNNQVVLTQ
jgi:hypothetical protein